MGGFRDKVSGFRVHAFSGFRGLGLGVSGSECRFQGVGSTFSVF